MIVSEPERHLYVKNVQQLDEVVGPARGNGAGAHGVFEGEIPPDDPGEEFAESGVSVSVGTPGQRNHSGELGIAKSRERASQAGDYEGKHQSGARIVRAESGKHEDASSDNRAHAESGELAAPYGALEPVFSGFTRLHEQHVPRLLY